MRQCCEGLPETGIADDATWAKLLGPGLQPKQSRDLTADMMINVPGLTSLGGSSDGGVAQPAAPDPAADNPPPAPKPAYADLFAVAAPAAETAAPSGNGEGQKPLTGGGRGAPALGCGVGRRLAALLTFPPHPPTAICTAAWPVLHEGDGGREVHALQVALERAGYYPSGALHCLPAAAASPAAMPGQESAGGWRGSDQEFCPPPCRG